MNHKTRFGEFFTIYILIFRFEYTVQRLYIPVPLEDARFRKLERFIIKAHFLSRVVPLKRNVTQGMICSGFPKGWFRNALCCVIDFENTLHGWCYRIMQELIILNNHYLQSMPCLKAFLIPAESCIFKWSGYNNRSIKCS